MHFNRPLKVLFFKENSVNFVFESSYISHHNWEKFKIYGVQITGNCILKSKKLKVDIFTRAMPPQENLSQGRFLSSFHPLRQRKITHSPSSIFFLENLFPPAEREGGEESMVSLDLHSLKPNI